MPQSLSAVYIHLVFSTKDRRPLLRDKPTRDALHSYLDLEQVKQYIAGQEEHHRNVGFQDELRALLKRHEIEWDEKYVWD